MITWVLLRQSPHALAGWKVQDCLLARLAGDVGVLARGSSGAVKQASSAPFHVISLCDLGFSLHVKRENIHSVQKQRLKISEVKQSHFLLILLVK